MGTWTEQYEIIDVWAVYQGDDDRLSGYPTWWFDNESDAQCIAKGRGWWGGNAPVKKHPVILVGDKAYLLAHSEPLELNVGPEEQAAEKEAALSKLSDREKRLLGLTNV